MQVVCEDALLFIAAAMIERAKLDYAAGPALGRHYETAEQFLRDAGLLDMQGISTPIGEPVAMVDGCAKPLTKDHYV